MFYDWLLERYLGKDTPRGDLAYDAKREKDFPKLDDRTAILHYLGSKHACREAVGVFKRAYRDYAKEMGLPPAIRLHSEAQRLAEDQRARKVMLAYRLEEERLEAEAQAKARAAAQPQPPEART
jgi:uncharacterized protein YozE (UPF0346 family)